MIEQLLPDAVVVATRTAMCGAQLFAEEERSVERAVSKRRQEFTTGRACARLALERLGIAPVAIASGERGEPLWPSGVVGSITHCQGYCAAAVSTPEKMISIGIDAEVHVPLPEGVLEQVAFGRERAMVADTGAGLCLDTVLFSAKESVYKAWFPLTRRWLGFEDVDLTIDVDAGSFCARLLVPRPVVHGIQLSEFRGRWLVADGIVAAASVVLPR